MDTRKLTLGFARTRLAIGVALIVAPTLSARLWGGSGPGDPTTKLFVRTTGIREAAMGLGTEISAKSGERPADWLSMCAVVDFGDAVFSVLGRGRWTRKVIGASALGAAVVQLVLAQRFAEELGHDPRA